MKKDFKIGLLFLCIFCFASCNLIIGGSKTENGKTVKNPTVSSERSANLDFIFNTQSLGSTTIVIKRSEWNKLCDNYRYFYKNENCVKAESYIYEKDGKTWELKDVGFRLRGNTSRFCPQGYDNGREQDVPNVGWSKDYYDYIASNPNNKDYRQSHFKVDFEEFCADGEEQKLAGCMKGVALKRMDGSCTREIFCYDLFHRYGIWTAPRASHTKVTIKFIEDEKNPSATEPSTTVNYGVYEMFEEVNKQSLKARDKDENSANNAWKNSKGNLWKCAGSALTGTWGMGIEDIRIIMRGEQKPAEMETNGREDETRVGYVWTRPVLDLKTNKDNYDVAAAEFTSFINDLNALPNPSTESDNNSINEIKEFYEKWFDVDFLLKTYAVNILCGMDDDYWGNANNYYLYFDTGSEKSTGKVYFIPFDYDNTLGCSIKDGGFKHNPLNWGRGENRPLIDKLLKVPEYKQKFIELLLEVSAENSEWTFEKGSERFLNWKSMVEPYLYSSDLAAGHCGTLNWYDSSWGPSGYKLTEYANNLYDATRFYFRLNLGQEVGGLDSGSSEKVITNPSGLGGSSNCKLEVQVKDDGLRIKKSHNSAWDHVAIHVYDETDGVENARISTNQNANEFLYPFVQKGHLYTVWLTLQSEKYSWYYLDAKSEGISVLVQADGGIGNYRITNSGYRYYSQNYSIIFDDLQFIEPDVDYQNERIEGTICDDGDWHGNTIYPNNLKITKSLTTSSLDLSSKKDFLRGKTRIFVDINKKFTYKNLNYEYTIVANYDNFFVDTNQDESQAEIPQTDAPKEIIEEETGSSADKDGETVTVSKAMQNPDRKTSSQVMLSVTPKYNGLYIEKSHNEVWDHVSIHVYDQTAGIENIRIVTNQFSNKFLYPFVQKGHEYKVWLTVQAESYSWYYSNFSDVSVYVEAVGGKGNYWIDYSNYHYDSPSYSVVFDDFVFARPQLDGVTPHIDGAIYYNDDWNGESRWPNNLPLNNSTVDLSSEKEFLFGQTTIFVSLSLKFRYEGIDYEYTFLENYGNLFIDTNK
ncbi:MAG: CotH kinase family protein [Treponema sp.]|nr:CotH kinase family protein [Treponema sp.]